MGDAAFAMTGIVLRLLVARVARLRSIMPVRLRVRRAVMRSVLVSVVVPMVVGFEQMVKRDVNCREDIEAQRPEQASTDDEPGSRPR